MIDVYPIGWLSTAEIVRSALKSGNYRYAWGRTKQQAVFNLEWAREGKWRTVLGSFYGYLAEPNPWPPGLKTCGRGWTRKAAIRSLKRRGYSET